MRSEYKYLETMTQDEIWQRYCGYLDLSIDEFMGIQNELLMDEIERVADSVLGKKIMGNQRPRSVEEFRRIVPLTTYDDYEPFLSEQQEQALAIKPHFWCHSAGRGGRFKWLPYSLEFFEKVIKNFSATFILASACKKGDVNISPGFKFLAVVPPPPYVSGYLFQMTPQYFPVRIMPDPEKMVNMPFAERIQEGFQLALKDGVDVIGAMGSILVRMGEAMSEKTRRMKFSASMLHPKIVLRIIRAKIRSKRAGRSMLPKDLWPAKAVMTGGLDTAIYKDDIAYYWGSEPYESYNCVETTYIAAQSWNKKGMVFFPDLAFFEFIPYKQSEYEDGKEYQPSPVLLKQLEKGGLYEVVITQFYGMPLLRYRMKDIVKVIALKDDETGINLPHIVFHRRADDVINLGGLCWLDEKTIWQAIANSGIKYTEWSACKEYVKNKSFLRLYLELKEQKEAAEVETMIDEQLRIVDTDYKDIDSYLDLQPVRVTLLTPGTFQRYMEEKRKEGADLAHLKPAHINPSESVVQLLLELSQATNEER